MMKLSQDERTASKTGLSKFKTLLLFVLLSEIIFPQIPFKGFCKLNSFSIDSGFTKIFSFNFDQNEHSDLLVFNPIEKKAKIFIGSSGTKFISNKTISFPLEVSVIEPIILPNNMIETFAFSSRKKRSFGIYKFSSTGNPSIITKLKLDSYPENISIKSNHAEGYSEFLISGNSFNGLSIISYQKNNLKEKKITQNRLFQNAQFIDINSDGFEDIAALNSIENKLHLFFNNSRGDYTELRYLSFSDDVLSMKVFDINYDQFKDLIISTTSGVMIYFGDATASFSKSVQVKTEYSVDKFIIGDFNRDGFFDINYINTDKGIISTIFAKEFFSFYPELIHKKKKGIIDVIPFFSKFVYGAAFLNMSGEVNILSAVSSMSDDQQLAIGIEPNLITSFDHIDNGIVDFSFTDEFDKKLKFIIRNTAGLPEKIYEIKLYEDHTKLLEFSNSKSVKTFFLFSTDKRVIEAIEIDFEKYSFKRRFHYAEGPIQDLTIKTDNKGVAELFILYSKNEILNLQVITKTAINYNQKLYTDLTSNWFNPFLFFEEGLTIGYWQFESDLIKLNFLNLNEKDRNPLNKLVLSRNNQLLISSSNKLSGKEGFNFTGLFLNEEEIYLVTGRNEPKLYQAKNTKNGFRIPDKNQLFFGKTNSIFVYNSKLKALTEFTTSKLNDQLFMADKINDIELSNYTIQNLDQRNFHLIFTNNKSGNIEVRQLSR